MNKLDRVQELHTLLKQHRCPISVEYIAEKLECSTRTVTRTINDLRDKWFAPLTRIKGQGWKYSDPDATFELPGLWLTSQELIRLNSLLVLIKELDHELINKHMQIIAEQIGQLLRTQQIEPDLLQQKIKILPTNKYTIQHPVFDTLHQGLIQEKQLYIDYSDYNGQHSERYISPLQIVYYQENWYLDSYCHLRESLRQFKVANIQQARLHNKAAKAIDQESIKTHFASSYGIFAGQPKHTVTLRFYNQAAHEAASLQWHPKQQSDWQGQHYLLRFPYNDDRELIRTILKYGNNVQVLAPAELKDKIRQIAGFVLELYE